MRKARIRESSCSPAEQVPCQAVLATPLDPYLPLRALAGYCGLSVRKLRQYLDDPAHPLPAYRVGGKILIRRSEFDGWIQTFRRRCNQDVEGMVAEVLDSVRAVHPRHP